MQRPMKLNLPPPIDDFQDFLILLFIPIKAFDNDFLRLFHGCINLAHRRPFFTIHPTKHTYKRARHLQTKHYSVPKRRHENYIGYIFSLLLVCPFTFYPLVNIFLKLFLCSLMRDKVIKAVANRVLAGLNNSLCSVNRLIMLSKPVLL